MCNGTTGSNALMYVLYVCMFYTGSVKGFPNGTIGKSTNGNQRTLNVFQQPMVSLVSFVKLMVPMVSLVCPLVPTVVY